MSYAEMNRDNKITDKVAQSGLLVRVLHSLSPAQIKKIANKLESDRKHFCKTSAPGHIPHYDYILAECALFECLTQHDSEEKVPHESPRSFDGELDAMEPKEA